MSEATTAKQPEKQPAKQPAKQESTEPGRWQVRVSHPVSNKRVVFSSISERRARQWLMNRAPRGEEMYLESPTGDTESYVIDRREGDYGEEVDEWQAFDPDAYNPQDVSVPPGTAGWPDVEG